MFAAGVLLYLGLVGTLPFKQSGPAGEAPNLPFDLVRQSPRLQSLIDATLTADPANRIADGAALESAIDAVRQSLAGARRRARWRRALTAIASVAVIVATTVGAIAWLDRGPHEDDLDHIVGRWRSKGGKIGSVLITRDPRGGYRWLEVEDESVNEPRNDLYRNEGSISVSKTPDAYQFFVNAMDVDGWCCGNFGSVVFEVYNDDILHMISSEWWREPSHFVDTHYDFYLYRVEE